MEGEEEEEDIWNKKGVKRVEDTKKVEEEEARKK